MRRHNAFSLIDVIFTIVMGILLMATLFSTFTKARETAKRGFCQKNLENIGEAISLYANANEQYPGLVPVSGKFDGPYETVTDTVSRPITSDCNANAYALLVYRGYASYKMFICPSTTDEAQKITSNSTTFGFDSASKLSYGLQPGSGATTAVSPSGSTTYCYLGASGMSGSTVIVGDKTSAVAANPATTNHGTDKGVENMLTFSGGVKQEKWSVKPVITGTTNSVLTWGSSQYDSPFVIEASGTNNPGSSDSYLYTK